MRPITLISFSALSRIKIRKKIRYGITRPIGRAVGRSKNILEGGGSCYVVDINLPSPHVRIELGIQFNYYDARTFWGFFERAIFQIFWKDDCCTDFLFFELETSNFGSSFVFSSPLNLRGPILPNLTF